MPTSGGSFAKRAAACAIGLAGVLFLPAVASAAPPANDDFANAQQLSGGLPLSFSGSLVDDTREAGEPANHGEGRGASAGTVWYSWTATQTGTVRARFRSTSGLVFNPSSPATDDRPFLAAYTGSAVNSLTPVPLTFSTIVDGDQGDTDRVQRHVRDRIPVRGRVVRSGDVRRADPRRQRARERRLRRQDRADGREPVVQRQQLRRDVRGERALSTGNAHPLVRVDGASERSHDGPVRLRRLRLPALRLRVPPRVRRLSGVGPQLPDPCERRDLQPGRRRRLHGAL